MVTKKVTTGKKTIEPPPSPPSPQKSWGTAALGVGMIILTNYQSEVKQVLSLIIKALT